MRLDDLRGSWRRTGWLIAIGAVVLLVGLLGAPRAGGSEDPSASLTSIAMFSTRWIVTNGLDVAGLALVVVGLAGVSRLLAVGGHQFLLTSAANVGGALGGLQLAGALVIRSTVLAGLAARFVGAEGPEQSAHLLLGRAVLDLERGLFGLGLAIFMAAVASAALALERSRVLPLNSGFLFGGIMFSALAAFASVAFLIEPLRPFGRLEPFFTVAGFVWLAALGIQLIRNDSEPAYIEA
jgi:hypothetical protein